MKIAFACWEDRIAPVFDTARKVSLVEVMSGAVVSRKMVSLPDELPLRRASLLSDLGIHTLICGAISQSLQVLIVSHGIAVIPFVAGDLEEVIQAWLGGELISEKFVMPGCCGRGLRGRIGRSDLDPCQGSEAALGPGAGMGDCDLNGAAGCQDWHRRND